MHQMLLYNAQKPKRMLYTYDVIHILCKSMHITNHNI